MYYAMRASAPSLHRESTDSLIHWIIILFETTILQERRSFDCFDRDAIALEHSNRTGW